MADDNVTDPSSPGHLPVAGEFDAHNPMPSDSEALNTSDYDESSTENDPEHEIM